MAWLGAVDRSVVPRRALFPCGPATTIGEPAETRVQAERMSAPPDGPERPSERRPITQFHQAAQEVLDRTDRSGTLTARVQPGILLPIRETIR
ncbi:hypothetical protein [Thermomicrobium sp.]